jgi:malate dehydrogenase (oxaloacetate-decarboxylating)
MHNCNEVLCSSVLTDHLAELLPVVYDPTVGDATEAYSDEYRGQRGVYSSIDHPDEIEDALQSFGLGPDDVCSDAEEMLGIGDWGVGSSSRHSRAHAAGRPASSLREGFEFSVIHAYR